jgi:hypothetical protein
MASDPKLRLVILQTGEEFRKALAKADQWEAQQRPQGGAEMSHDKIAPGN